MDTQLEKGSRNHMKQGISKLLLLSKTTIISKQSDDDFIILSDSRNWNQFIFNERQQEKDTGGIF